MVQADRALLSRAFPLLVACGSFDFAFCRHLVNICIVLINTFYEDYSLKHLDTANCQRQPQFGCWPEAGLAVGAISLATSHSPTNLPAAVAEPSNSGHANSVQARASAGQPAAGPCRCSTRPDTAPSHHTSAQTPANGAPRQKPGGAGQRRRHHPEPDPKGRVQEDIRGCIMHTAAAQGTETTRNRNHTGLSLTDFVSVDTGNVNREFTDANEHDCNENEPIQLRTRFRGTPMTNGSSTRKPWESENPSRTTGVRKLCRTDEAAGDVKTDRVSRGPPEALGNQTSTRMF